MKKTLVKNSIYNILYKGLNIAFPLITVTYVSRVLLASGIGKIAYAQNIVQYFVLLAALGIPNYGIREISKANLQSNEKRDKVFSELFIINFISTLFFSLVYYFIIILNPYFEKNFWLYTIVGITIILNIFNVDWFYQGIEEYRYIAIRSFLVKLVSLALIFVFVRDKNDINSYAAISCFSTGGNYILNIIQLKRIGVKFSFRNAIFKKHIKPIIIMFCSVLSVELYTLLDTTMVGAIAGSISVGYYTNAMKLIRILITLVTAISGVLLPRLSQYHMEGKEKECSDIVSNTFKIMMFIFLPCQIGIFILSNVIVGVLFGESFEPATITLRIASFLICTLGFSNLFGTQVLLTYSQEKKMLITTIVGAVSNIIMNALLIPIYEQNGAAIASVISEGLVTLLSIVFAKKYIHLYIEKRYIYCIVISGIIMAIGVLGLRKYISAKITLLVVAIMVGAIIYILCNLIMKNPVLKKVKEVINSRNERM